MAKPGIDPLHDLAVRMRRDDPVFARGLAAGQPRRPREYRRHRGPVWVLLAVSVVLLAVGMVLPQGLLLAAGLVAAGMAVNLLPLPQDPDRPSPPAHAPAPPPGSDPGPDRP